MTDDPWYINTWCGLTGYSTRYSNITWGTGYLSRGGSKISISGQEWNWDDARTYYYQAMTGTSGTDRGTYFAKSFQALGQVLHLLEDMAVPAHTRNDFRSHLNYQGISLSWPTSWFGNNFEHYVKNNPGLVSGTSAIPSFTLLTDFWDTDGSAAGLAEFTNANYFSDETIPNNNPTAEHTFPHPSVNNASHQICEDYVPGSTDIRKYISRGVGSPCPQPGHGTVDHFATPSLLNEDFEITNDNISMLRLWLDDNVHDTYAKELLPKAVGYSAGLLNYFFRGKINMDKDQQNTGKYIIKNESSERMEGTFALYYDDASGNRYAVPGASWTLTTNPNSTSSPVAFTEPTSPAPKEKGKYILAFNGKLGPEEGAVVGREVKLGDDIWEPWDRGEYATTRITTYSWNTREEFNLETPKHLWEGVFWYYGQRGANIMVENGIFKFDDDATYGYMETPVYERIPVSGCKLKMKVPYATVTDYYGLYYIWLRLTDGAQRCFLRYLIAGSPSFWGAVPGFRLYVGSGDIERSIAEDFNHVTSQDKYFVCGYGSNIGDINNWYIQEVGMGYNNWGTVSVAIDSIDFECDENNNY